MAPVKRAPPQYQHRVYFREWREFARPDLSQAAVARLIDADHSSLQRLEAGKNPYNAWWLETLAVVYGCKPWDLISRDPRGSRGFKIDIFRDYQSAPAELQRQVDSTVRTLLRPSGDTNA
jgi:Helix-turn-helix domain